MTKQKILSEYDINKFRVIVAPDPNILCFGNLQAQDIIAAAFTAHKLFISMFGRAPESICMHPTAYSTLVRFITEAQSFHLVRSRKLRLVNMCVSVSYGMECGTMVVSNRRENYHAKG